MVRGLALRAQVNRGPSTHPNHASIPHPRRSLRPVCRKISLWSKGQSPNSYSLGNRVLFRGRFERPQKRAASPSKPHRTLWIVSALAILSLSATLTAKPESSPILKCFNFNFRNPMSDKEEALNAAVKAVANHPSGITIMGVATLLWGEHATTKNDTTKAALLLKDAKRKKLVYETSYYGFRIFVKMPPRKHRDNQDRPIFPGSKMLHGRTLVKVLSLHSEGVEVSRENEPSEVVDGRELSRLYNIRRQSSSKPS